jgi:hypothetical protein
MAANVARLRTDMEEAKRVVGGAMEGVQGAVDIAKNALIGMAGAFTADAIISQVTSLIGGLAELDDAAESAGSSVETMSALLGVGVQSGKNLNEVVGIVTALNRAMVSAEADTSKAAIAFKALGLNLTGFSDSGLALQAFAQKLGEFEDGANKSQIAIMALGRSGAAAVPFLKDLADAGAITGKITGEQAAEFLDEPKSSGAAFSPADLARIEACRLNQEKAATILRAVQELLAEKGLLN